MRDAETLDLGMGKEACTAARAACRSRAVHDLAAIPAQGPRHDQPPSLMILERATRLRRMPDVAGGPRPNHDSLKALKLAAGDARRG
jgi:hypothetical protein